jgi:apolipoprotein N-acyltransferase
MNPHAWLVLGSALGLVATGAHTLPLATWLSATFLLRFSRQQPTLRGYLAIALLAVPVMAWSWSLFPFGGPIGRAVFAILTGFIGAVPYLLDRLMAPAERGWARTLSFPITVTAVEIAGQIGNDLGSWGATAYTQVDADALRQVVAVTGLPGVTFIVALGAALLNDVWEAADRQGLPARPTWLAGLGVLVVLAVGQVRLHVPPSDGIRVAGISGPRWNGLPGDLRDRYRGDGPFSAQDQAAVRSAHAREHERLFAAAEREARAGARLVTFSEAAVVVVEADRDAALDRARRIAVDTGATLVVPLGVLETGPAPRKLHNEVVLALPDGRLSTPYAKAIPTPGGERSWTRAGDGRLVPVDTPIGRVATVICFDADFPDLVAQAGPLGVDLLIVPAGDWPAVARIHADMARLRAVEQGISVLRVASAGVSTAIDPRGAVWGRHRYPVDGDTLVATVPVGHRPTVYGTVGRWFDALVCVGFVLSAIAATRRRRASR